MARHGPQVHPGLPEPTEIAALPSGASLREEGQPSLAQASRVPTPSPGAPAGGWQGANQGMAVHADPRTAQLLAWPAGLPGQGLRGSSTCSWVRLPPSPESALLPAAVVPSISTPAPQRPKKVRPGSVEGLAVALGPEPPGRPGQGPDSPSTLRRRCSLALAHPTPRWPSGGRGPACLGPLIRAPGATSAAG